MSSGKAFAVGAYLIVSFLIQIALLVNFWPVTQTDGTWEKTWSCWVVEAGCRAEDDTRLIVIVLLGGGVGAMVHAIRSFSAHIGARRLSKGWAWWYVLRPLEGAVMALAFYLVLRGGLLNTSGSNGSSAANISIYGVTGIAVLVGMFSREAVEKLKDLAETLFAKANQAVTTSSSKALNPKPTVTSCEPAAVSHGTPDAPIHIRGKDFTEHSVVQVAGVPRKTTFISAAELEVFLTADDTKDAGESLKVVVTTPSPGGGSSEQDVAIKIT
jgi:hypothetical protein